MTDLLYSNALPERFANVADVHEFMTRPSAALVADLEAVAGDIVILGAGGKMGPTLAQLARRAAPASPTSSTWPAASSARAAPSI
jgi:hypothetical protein